jgi:hypothetical protein
MPDVYSIITTVDPAVVARIADAMEISAAGFTGGRVRSHGYVQIEDPAYASITAEKVA